MAKRKKKKKEYVIDQDTPILPYIVAGTVVQEVERYTGEALSNEYVEALVAHAHATYNADASFRRKIRAKGNKGRDTLYAFMRHWLAADLKKKQPDIYEQLPSGFASGEPLDNPGRAPNPRKKKPKFEPTPEQERALQDYIAWHGGEDWNDSLQRDFMRAGSRWPGEWAYLQQVRNSPGGIEWAMVKQTRIEDSSGLHWLRKTFIPQVDESVTSHAVIYGSEGAPEKIVVYVRTDDNPVRTYVPGPQGPGAKGYVLQKKRKKASKKTANPCCGSCAVGNACETDCGPHPNPNYMTKAQFEEDFKENVIPHIGDDPTSRRTTWNDQVDAYVKDGMLPDRAYDWSHPRWLETRKKNPTDTKKLKNKLLR